MNSIYGSDFGGASLGTLADIAGDIILRTDRHGFIEQSSPGLRHLGVSIDGFLIFPHISELAAPRFAEEVRAYVRQALEGSPKTESVEFPLIGKALHPNSQWGQSAEHIIPKWFALRMRPDRDRFGQINGALGLLRQIEEPHAKGAQSLRDGNVDHLTGLRSRQAFDANLAARLRELRDDILVMVEIDAFRSLSLRFGPSAGEEIIRAFAEFLTVILGDGRCISRLKDARFAFFLEKAVPQEARRQVEELVSAFARLSSGLAGEQTVVSASAGLASLRRNGAISIKQAEKALIMASNTGGSRVRIVEELPHYLARKQHIL